VHDVVIAGGSGGLGSAAVRMLAKEWRVVFSYFSNAERAQSLASVGKPVQADLSDAEDRRNLLDAAPELYGLAVFSGDPARVSEPAQMETAMRRSHEVNYLGPILLISSMQAVDLFAGSTAYAAQKAALVHAGRVLAKELRGKPNIRVNVICPGVNQAGMAEASIASGKYNSYVSDGAIPRFGRAEDVARAVRFFFEPDNYITGQVLTVDGGLTL
jgi:3alpha(or 20beta)-hydroxysteroid dehydrogenase